MLDHRFGVWEPLITFGALVSVAGTRTEVNVSPSSRVAIILLPWVYRLIPGSMNKDNHTTVDIQERNLMKRTTRQPHTREKPYLGSLVFK